MKQFEPSFPTQSLYWLLAGIGFILVPVFFHIFHIDPYYSDVFTMAYYLSPIAGLGFLWGGRDVARFFFGQKNIITLDEKTWQVGGDIPRSYDEITGLNDQTHDNELHIITTTSKTPIIIHGNFYEAYDEIYAIFIDMTFDFLLQKSEETIKSEPVSFGRSITLTQDGVVFKKKPIAYSEIRSAYIYTGTDNGSFSFFHIKTKNDKKIELPTHEIINLSILKTMIDSRII